MTVIAVVLAHHEGLALLTGSGLALVAAGATHAWRVVSGRLHVRRRR